MNFDTENGPPGDDDRRGGSAAGALPVAMPVPRRGSALRRPSPAQELLTDDHTPRIDRSDDQLLSWLDTQFAAQLEQWRARAAADDAAPLSPAQRLLAERQAERARDESARQAYARERALQVAQRASLPALKAAQLPPLAQHSSHANVGPSGRRVPRKGIGHRLYIGFDAEWTEKGPGRNRIISVQFVVVGPTGEVYQRIFDLDGDTDRDLRLRLADALDVVLDEAEQACVFEEWPHEVVLAGYFLRGDLTAFADFSELRPQLDGIGGTLGTVAKPAKLTLPMDEARQARLKSRYRLVMGDDFDPRVLRVRILDVSRLTPPGTTLEKVGQWLGKPKVELPPGYDKADMPRFKRREPEKFREYALHDAWLAVFYALWVLWFCDRHLGLKGLSATVSGLSVRLGELCMRQDGVHPDVALNFEHSRRVVWDARLGRPVTRRQRVPSDIRRWLEPFLADVFQGGRNEAYVFGPSEVGTWYDSDLAGAYVTGLAVFMSLDYAQARFTRDLVDFIGSRAGFAQVAFRFPQGTRFPCLPVQVDTGLWFPLSGVSLCTAAEIELAQAMGAELDVRFGVVIPPLPREEVFARSAPLFERWRAERAARQNAEASSGRLERAVPANAPADETGAADVFVARAEMQFPPPSHGDEGYRPMESFGIFVRWLRLRFQRKSLPFEFCKLVGNTLYGTTGQGYSGVRSFGPRQLASQPIGPSRVSEAAIAALVCGFVRATVSEILWKLPPDATALSLTTDGALMSVPTDQLDLTGSICQRYQALVDRVAPGTAMVEAKHQVRQVFIPRTRGCFTVERDEEHPALCAKAGHKVLIPDDLPDADKKRLRTPEGESDWMIRLALGRYPRQKLPRESFFSLREQLINEWDLQKKTLDVAVALEYDFKRRPVNPRMVRMAPYGAEHLAFDTEPWDCVEDAMLTREVFRRWKQENNLKTLDDWHRWQAALVVHLGNRRRRVMREAAPKDARQPATLRLRGATGQKHLRGGSAGPLRLVVRTFLAAFTQGAWGLAGEKERWTYKELALWLTELGYPVSESDIKNARRSRLDEGVAADTPEVRTFLDRMKERFAGLEVGRFVAAG